MNTLGKIAMMFLIVLNSIFLILGIGLFIGGIVLYERSGINSANIQPLFERITVGGTNLGSIVKMIGAIVIVAGLCSFGLIVMGLVGASKKKKGLLIAYAVFVGVVIILELVVIGGSFTLKNELNTSMKRTMLELLSGYEGNRGGPLTTAWNWLFMSLHCCGVNEQSQINDFIFTIWWRNIFLRGSNQLPGFCCVGAEPNTAALNVNGACTISPTPLNSYINRGCFDAIKDIFTTYGVTFIIIAVIILLVEVCAIIFSAIMVRQLKNGSDKKTVA